MLTDWNLSALCPVLKKGDSTICANYRGISLLPIAYKVFTTVLCERLKSNAKALIGIAYMPQCLSSVSREADKALQNDVEELMQLRQGRKGPLRTF